MYPWSAPGGGPSPPLRVEPPLRDPALKGPLGLKWPMLAALTVALLLHPLPYSHQVQSAQSDVSASRDSAYNLEAERSPAGSSHTQERGSLALSVSGYRGSLERDLSCHDVTSRPRTGKESPAWVSPALTSSTIPLVNLISTDYGQLTPKL